MPTFDFANILRKLLAGAISLVCSPVTAVLAAAALLTEFLDDIITFFGDDFSIPEIEFPKIVIPSDGSSFYDMFLYAVNWDMCSSFLNSVISFVERSINFGISFFISLGAVLVAVGVYRVVRQQLKDTVG